MNKKVIILGSNSFIATNLISAIKAMFPKVQLSGFSRNNKNEAVDQFYFIDYPKKGLDFTLLLDSDLIINCLGAGIQANKAASAIDILEINTFLPIQIFYFLQEAEYTGTFINFGSYFEIGNEDRNINYTEEEILTSTLPVSNAYCISKRILNRFVNDFSCTSFKYYHLILPTIYGEGENPKRLIPYIISCIKNQEIPKLTSGVQVRQYLHIEDLCSQIISIFNQRISIPSDVYNLSSSDIISVKDLVAKIFSLWEGSLRVDWGGLKRLDVSMKYLILNSSKLEQFLNHKNTYSLDTGILQYKNNKDE